MKSQILKQKLDIYKLNNSTFMLIVKDHIRRKTMIQLLFFAVGALIITGGVCFGAGFAAGKATHEIEVQSMIERYYTEDGK